MYARAAAALLGVIASRTAFAADDAAPNSSGGTAVERSGCPTPRVEWSQKALLPIVKGNGFEGVILPAEAATAVLCQCSRDSLGVASGSWTPTLSDLAEMEARLPDYVRARPQAAMPNKRRDLRIYLRQYVGIERGGRRRIYVNLLGGEIFSPARRAAHGRAVEHAWRSTAFVMCDGGPDFFGLEYDIASRQFTRIDFNL